MQLHLPDDGQYLVTLDEVRWGGTKNAVVVYGSDGGHLRTWKLTELLLREDWPHVTIRKPSIEWLDKAVAEFTSPDTFQIKLPWGRILRFDLKQLSCLDAPDPQQASAAIPPEIAELLAVAERDDQRSRDSAEKENAGIDVAQLETAAESIANEQNPALALHWWLLKAAVTAELTAAAESAASESSAATDEITPAGSVESGADGTAYAPLTGPGSDGALYPVVASDAARATGILVPLPDPARPVDFLGWMKSQTEVGDPSARLEMQGVMDKTVKFSGDGDLQSRALKGDPEALKDPAIQQWRAANAEALQHFRDFTLYPYRGPELSSQDGSLIGILLPHLGQMREASRVAIVEAHTLAAEQKYQEAADLLADTLRAGAKTGQGPTLIENLVGTAMQSIASDALLDLAGNPEFAKSADLPQITAALEMASAKPRSLAENMQFERAMVMDMLQRSFEFDPESQMYRPLVTQMTQQLGGIDEGQLNAFEVLQIATLDYQTTVSKTNSAYDQLTENVSKPYAVVRDQMQNWEREFEESERNPLLRRVLPAISRAAGNRGRADAKQHAALLVQNLLVYQQQHGALPDSLGEFAGREFVTDPLTGDHFRYERTADGFRLYSIGMNGLDDGGMHDERGETNDIVYWPRPARP